MTGRNLGRDRQWRRAAREHSAALESFLSRLASYPEPAWERPLGEGKWTPAEVTEHLALTYVAALRELEEGRTLAPRVSPARQTVFRWFLLPHMLFHRSMPRAGAPRETRPTSPQATREELQQRLGTLARQVEERLKRQPDARLTHPYFGRIGALQALRLMALHLEHHERQLSAVVSSGR